MNFNLITNIEICSNFVRDIVPVSLVYYSHIPAGIVALLIGFFVFLKNRRDLASRALLLVCVTFSLWVFSDIILWIGYDSRIYMLLWTWAILLEVLFFVFSFYFVYVFIKKSDIPFKVKLFFGALILPVVFLMNTKYHITMFSITDCNPIEGPLWKDYVLPLEILIFLIIAVFSVVSYRKSDKVYKKQIVFIAVGVESFLLIFFSMFFISDYLIEHNITDTTHAYSYELYGLFGMPIFMGFLAYLIVKYKAFNIKLIATQALMVTLIILIGSQFSFIRNNTNKILTAITLVIAVVFGWILVRSVKKEIKQKEELALANKEISKRKEQLQKISDSLAISNEKLKQLDSAKTEFISMASHQLRTPVTGIKGYTSMLIEGGYGEVTPEQKGALKKTYESNERMSTLIEDLLNVSKIESGKLEYEFSKFKMAQICQEVVDTLFPKAKDHNLYLEYKPPKKALPELMIDGTKVREVISNLVDNAVKYTPKGGVTLALELCAKNEPNCLSKPHIRITVSDTGIGVPPEEVEYLFLKFSRGKDVHRLNATGTGLGLFVGKKMIEGNGGKIWLESDGKGKGSRFIVELPLEQDPALLEG